MGRKVSSGVSPQGFGNLAISSNTLSTVGTDETLIINPNGTGGVQIETTTTVTSGNVVIQNGQLVINAQGDTRYYDSDSSNYVAFQAPATVSANVTWTLPAADATTNKYALISNGSGTLSWGATGPVISNDTATSTAVYPIFTSTSNALIDGANVCTTKLTFKPSNGQLALAGGTAASDTTTGTLVVTGGVGISGALYGGAGAQFTNLGIGTAPSGTSGEIRATNNITAYYTSDIKFKENIKDIPDALGIVSAIGGKLFDWSEEYINSRGGADGYFVQKSDFGVIAQHVQSVFPRAVRTKEDGTLAVDYEKLSAIAFAAIVELKKEVEELKSKIEK